MTTTYAMGDLQGCYVPFAALLEQIDFTPQTDRLWLAGDLVNRGPDSHAVINQLYAWHDRVQIVLGNHDLYALARWAGITAAKKNDTLGPLLADPHTDDWMEWLRTRSLLHTDLQLGWSMVHAAIHPDWDMASARGHADAVEDALRDRHWRRFLKSLWDAPAPNRWEDCRNEEEAQRFRVAIFTRARYVTAKGIFNWSSTAPKDTAREFAPWHERFLEKQTSESIICGHWATQGLLVRPRLLALDSGCVWGRQLTAARIDMDEPLIYQTPCPMFARPDSG